jgi:hypothetical protein
MSTPTQSPHRFPNCVISLDSALTSDLTLSDDEGAGEQECSDRLFVFRFVTSELPQRGSELKFGMESLGAAFDKRSIFY